MRSARRTLKLITALATLLVAGCGGGGNSPAGPSPVPSPSPSPATGTQGLLRVTLDGPSCRTVAPTVDVFVDGTLIGSVTPGDAGVSKTVAVGDHTFGAVARNGAQRWDTRTINVAAVGHHADLTCSGGGGSNPSPSPSPAPPSLPDPLLEVRIDVQTCTTDHVTAAEVFIDGLRSGFALRGGATVRRNVTVGPHTVSANGDRRVDWGAMTVNVPQGGFLLTLTCS